MSGQIECVLKATAKRLFNWTFLRWKKPGGHRCRRNSEPKPWPPALNKLSDFPEWTASLSHPAADLPKRAASLSHPAAGTPNPASRTRNPIAETRDLLVTI